MIKSVTSVTPSYMAAYRRIMAMEAEYGITLKMWISCNAEPGGHGYFEIHIAGSGRPFDVIPAQLGTAKARVIAAFDDPFGSALWQCLNSIESALERHTGYMIAHPSHLEHG